MCLNSAARAWEHSWKSCAALPVTFCKCPKTVSSFWHLQRAVFYRTNNLMALQMFSDKGHQSILTAPTASSGWKNVRKGVMPAFSPQNIRFAWQFFSFLLLRS